METIAFIISLKTGTLLPVSSLVSSFIQQILSIERCLCARASQRSWGRAVNNTVYSSKHIVYYMFTYDPVLFNSSVMLSILVRVFERSRFLEADK